MKDSSKSKSSYSSEFREAAVAKCLEIGTTQKSKELGVAPSTLNTWKKKLSSNKGASKSGLKPSYEELEKEVRRLKKEMGYITEINEVLKKSTAIFCKDQMGGSR